MILHRVIKSFFSSDLNVSKLLRKKGILFENVKRENCVKDLIVKFMELKGVPINEDDIHIMKNILCRPTGRIMILIDNLKKQNFNFNFDMYEKKEEQNEREHFKDKMKTNNIKNGQVIKENEKNISDNKDIMNITNNNDDKTNIIYNKEEYYKLKTLFKDCKIHLCDDYEIEKFVEECERFLRFTDDIKRISKFENLDKIITIINIPSCYGRKELSEIIYTACNVRIELNNIIFRFKKNGIQSDCAYILCNNIKDANIIIHTIQEYPVAKKYHLTEFYGTSFLYASKNNLFISSEKLDYITIFSKYKIFTCGWHKDISIKEFESFLITLKIFPKKIIKINYSKNNILKNNENKPDERSNDKTLREQISDNNINQLNQTNPNHILINIEEESSSHNDNKSNESNEENDLNTSSFILFFENMRMTKKVFTKFERLKKKWKMSASNNFYAYPKIPDIHFSDDIEYMDENEYEDSDLDEEIEY
ncbi:hypothetical protein PRSY57_0811300 [Plasmodium reichenowi]|uniref:Uncharacterized protein n=1 Tax=Plasmodium reichenowi TaxID=5854 RepID=A0A151LK20_PLARE|nr:hypothetical protein PRSY57_0811300 [Plasmodium reichenowi]KYN99209.1 hypothetical protein PRSY57_0811300 [Plasmodium reichenowi]